MVLSQAGFRGNEATALSQGQLSWILRNRTSVDRRLELIQNAFPSERNGILRPFKPNSVGVFRFSDANTPFYRLGQIETEARNTFFLRDLPVAFDSAVPFFPADRSSLELFGPTVKFEYSPDKPVSRERTDGRQEFRRGRYEVVRVMAQPFLKRLAWFNTLGGYAYIYENTNVGLIADLAEASIPTEAFAKALLKNAGILGRLFPDCPAHADMIFRYPGERVAFHSIIGTLGDDTFRYPGGGMVWKDAGPTNKRKVADNTYPDILRDFRSSLILVRCADAASPV